jgi:hypothetical protein
MVTSNFNIDVAKGMIEISKVYTERVNKIFMLDSSWSMRMLFKVINPLLPTKTRERLEFIDTPTLL